jgi:tetratricopeptide (TPR) repeat protein
MAGARRRIVAGGLLGLFSALVPGLWSGAASAQAVNNTSTVAYELFAQGRALMGKKEYEAACAKFEESQRLDPGGGTLLNLALCYELSGRTATASAGYRAALRVARRDGRGDREKFAEQHIAALAPRLSRLRIVVPAATRSPGLTIRLNGIAIGKAAWGDALPVDPGLQIVQVTAPGKLPSRASIVVDEDADSRTLSIAPLTNAPKAVRTTQPVSAPRTEDPGTRRQIQQVSGIVLGGAGMAAIGAGVFLGLKAIDEQNTAEEKCPNANRCAPDAVFASRDAAADARASTAFILGGAAVFTTGAFLFFSAPGGGKAKLTPELGKHSAGASFAARF